MNSIERLAAFNQGLPVDRPPYMLFHGTFGARLTHQTYQESEATAGNIAAKEIAVYNAFGCDNVSVNLGLNGLGIILGSQMKYPEDASPMLDVPLLSSLDELDKIDLSKVSFEASCLLRKHDLAIQMIQDRLGQEVAVAYELTGPLTSAASLINIETLLRGTRRQPEQVHQLLELVTQATLRIIDAFALNHQTTFNITDPVSSGALISGKQYREFSQPYTQRIVEHIKQYQRGEVAIHICGDTTKFLTDIASTGVDYISIDQQVDLKTALEIVEGLPVGIIGNIDPVKYLLQGDINSIQQQVAQSYEAAKHSSTKYIIGPGCSVPLATPIQNVTAYVEAIMHYGRM